MQTKGNEQWRKTVLQEGTFNSVVALLNAGGWVFDDVHGQYVVALVALRRTDDPNRSIAYSGPFRDRASFEAHRDRRDAARGLDRGVLVLERRREPPTAA